MAQPEPAEIARHFHNAADQIALFNNLPAVHEAQMLQNIMDAITALRNDITALRNDMNTGFGRVETRLLAVEAGSLRVDHNSCARLHNANINNSQLPLQVLKTPQNNEPANFPINSAQLSTLPVGQLNTLLTAYGLPRDGTVEAKRKSFRQFIGILSDV